MPRVGNTGRFTQSSPKFSDSSGKMIALFGTHKWAGGTEVWSFVCFILANGNPRKGVKSWVKRGCNNKLPSENETNLCGSQKREQMHAKEKRICRELGPWEGGWAAKTPTQSPPSGPPPTASGTDGSSASPLTSSAVTMAITFTPCSHTICQKSWHVCGRGPWVAM